MAINTDPMTLAFVGLIVIWFVVWVVFLDDR